MTMDNNQTPVTAEKAAPKFDPVEFARETQREIAKVTWPTRKETVVTTGLIVLMALVAGVFFLGVDSVLGFAISKFLGMRG
jgi:preprotein translocase subunit SecE